MTSPQINIKSDPRLCALRDATLDVLREHVSKWDMVEAEYDAEVLLATDAKARQSYPRALARRIAARILARRNEELANYWEW